MDFGAWMTTRGVERLGIRCLGGKESLFRQENDCLMS